MPVLCPLMPAVMVLWRFDCLHRYLPWFLESVPSESCAKGGAGAYNTAIQKDASDSTGEQRRDERGGVNARKRGSCAVILAEYGACLLGNVTRGCSEVSLAVTTPLICRHCAACMLACTSLAVVLGSGGRSPRWVVGHERCCFAFQRQIHLHVVE